VNNQAISISHPIATKEKITVRVVPIASEIGRQATLATNRAQLGFFGIAAFLAQEGITEFASPEWGPAPVRLISAGWGDYNASQVGCAADSGIKTLQDMKGKRITWVVGSPGLNLNMDAFLAAAGLAWSDVKKVDVPSLAAAGREVIEGRADCFIISTNSGLAFNLASAPRGFYPVPMPRPEENPDAWKRFKAVAPYYEFNIATVGAAPVSKERPHVGSTYPLPLIVAYAGQDPQLVYYQTRLIYDLFPDYKDAYPGNTALALGAQRFTWVMPYHEAAVRYFKEKGAWTDAAERQNRELVRREDVLAKAWERALAEVQEKKVAPAGFADFWMAIRAEELKKAGLDPYWEKRFW